MRLAVFADGTWNRPEFGTGTNVVKLHNLAVDDEGSGQRTFYDTGVGTNGFDKIRGGVFGVGLSKNILDCYRFIQSRFAGSPGPHQILLFGFSRGAYTVRSLAGLLGRIGLVKDAGAVDRAYELYRKAMSTDPKDVAQRERFIADHVLTRPDIAMVGVWDTVGALGVPVSWLNKRFRPNRDAFHDTSLGPHIEAAYHAVAVDEVRVAYQPALWTANGGNPRQVLEQVYFPGVHSDVGGGYNDDPRLGDITLRWMGERAVRHGLMLKPSAKLPEITPVHSHGRIHEPMKWLPVRRERRKVLPQSVITHRLVERRQAPYGFFVPHPYDPPNLPQTGEYQVVAEP